jgi:hypothetical protein
MQKANYTNTSTTSGGQGKYPLSTQTLDFIQQQVMILQLLGYIGGSKYILRQPDGTNTGLVFIDGEVLTLAAKPIPSANIKYINVTTKKSDVKADGETYTEARVYRTAALSASSSGESYEYNKFTVLETNQTLGEKIKQVPQTVLTYLEDILAEKMPLLSKTGVTQAQLNGLTSPCVIACTKSVKIGDCTNYGVEVLPTGATNCVRQTVYLSDGRKYVRYYNGSTWVGGSDWKLEGSNLNLECKIVSGVVYIRHGQLPEGCKIIMLRKKHRSRWRSTGGSKSYTKNKGKRIPRSPKRQYVHYKGVVLSTSTAGTWYVPKCTAVSNANADSNMLNCELGGLCRPFVKQESDNADGNAVYKMTGVRNKITFGKSSHTQNSAYTQIGIQVVSYNADGSVAVGGNILKLKYHLRRQKKYVGREVIGNKTYPIYKYLYYRSFSME